MSLTTQRNGYVMRDRRGEKNAGGFGTYATPRNSGQQNWYRPRPFTGSDRVIDQYDWTEILDFSRQLFAQLGNIGSAIVQKNNYAVGAAWLPQYTGENRKWGDQAEEWLVQNWFPTCDVQGLDFQTNLFLTGLALDVDGDDLMLLTKSDSGFPMLQFIPAHRIKSGGSEVKGGPFDGAKICNGIIFNRDGRAIGYRIAGVNGDEPTDVSAFNADMAIEPEWLHQVRGIPRIARALMDSFDVQDIDQFLKRGVKLDASIGLIHYNESGEAQTPANFLGMRTGDASTTNPTDIMVESRYGGEVLYMRANSGEKLEGLHSERPHPNTEAFIARLERRILLSLGWAYELCDPSKIGGASVRLIQDMARNSVKSRQRAIRRRCRRAINYALAVAMKTGRLPRNEADWWKFDYEVPALLTVDAGYDEQADRENLKIGSSTLAEVCQKKGKWWEDQRKQKRREAFDLIDQASEVKTYAASKGMTLSDENAISMIQERSANPQPITPDTNDQTVNP